MNSPLFSKTKLDDIELKNHMVMAPMTRSRAINNIPNALMAQYYSQRAEAGLIVTEGTSPSPNGLGYARIPGIFSSQQIEGWKKVTTAVHAKNGKIFVQLMHTGRISHPANLPAGAQIMAPSAIQPKGQMWTDTQGMKNYPMPIEMTLADIDASKKEHVQAALNAVEAGFDGVELHGANGYLLDQFLNPASNRRTDLYGGNVEKRCEFVLEVASEVAKEIGKEKTGIRLSPYGAINDVGPFPETEEQYAYLAEKLNLIGIAYIHLVDHSSMGSPKVQLTTVQKIRNNFKNSIVLSGGYTLERAEKDLASCMADLIAFGRGFLANPDFVSRLQNKAELNPVATDTFYTAGAKGYTDYPALSIVQE
jgi:NADH:flavin oxidoreductases, Old Yellow Enzyme family